MSTALQSQDFAIIVKKGTATNLALSTTTLYEAELAYTIDTKQLWIADSANGKTCVNPTAPIVLATVTGIDAKTTGTTTLYTVPTGKTAIITGAYVRCTAATAITIGPTLGIGIAANEDDIFASTALATVTATTNVWGFVTSGLQRNAVATSVIKVGIDAASTGTSQTLAIDLVGYLI